MQRTHSQHTNSRTAPSGATPDRPASSRAAPSRARKPAAPKSPPPATSAPQAQKASRQAKPQANHQPTLQARTTTLPATIVETSALKAGDRAPLDIIQPTGAPSPLVVSCPHAGREYPDAMMENVPGGLACLRGLEDFAVDRLLDGFTAHGATTVINRVARAYLDVSRATNALDPAMFDEEVDAPFPYGHVQSGYGLLPRLTAERQSIYNRLLPVAEINRRIHQVHTPYHKALADLIDETTRRHGKTLLVDMHSMPDTDAFNRKLPDIVCGNVNGKTLSPKYADVVTDTFEEAGLSVGWNDPYAGGYITSSYGKVGGTCQSVQIEISRGLYMKGQDRLDNKGAAFLRETMGGLAMRLSEVCKT